jgi:hypothetical protein
VDPQYGSEVRYVRQQNQGVIAAVNRDVQRPAAVVPAEQARGFSVGADGARLSGAADADARRALAKRRWAMRGEPSSRERMAGEAL